MQRWQLGAVEIFLAEVVLCHLAPMDIAKKTWELENSIQRLEDEIFHFDPVQQKSIMEEKAWTNE